MAEGYIRRRQAAAARLGSTGACREGGGGPGGAHGGKMAMRWPGVSASTSAAAAAHFQTRLCFAATVGESAVAWVSATVAEPRVSASSLANVRDKDGRL